MKITNNNTFILNKKNEQPNNSKKNTSFGNGAGAVVQAATFLENNGFLGEFLAVDGLGMITPRTAQGYTRNKEELGHLNYKAGVEELVRELLSGPAFFFVPLGVVTAAGMLKGKAAKVTTKTLDSFKTVMNKTKVTDLKKSKEIKQNFVDTIIGNAFKDHSKGSEKVKAIKDDLTKLILPEGELTKKDKKAIKKNLVKNITDLNKENGIFVDNTNLIKVSESKVDGKVQSHSIPVTQLADDMGNYLEDYTKKAANSSSGKATFTEKFHKGAKRIRQITNIAAVAALSAFLSIIPKLYQVDKEFPGVDGLDVKGQTPSTPNSGVNAKGGQVANK